MSIVIISSDDGRVRTVVNSRAEIKTFDPAGEYDEDWAFEIPETIQISASQFLGCRDLSDLLRAVGGKYLSNLKYVK